MASVDDLWLVDFGQPFPDEPAHRCPALVVGPPDGFGQDVPFVIVCPLSTAHRRISLHIEVEPVENSGLDDVSYIQCELIRSVGHRRLIHRLGSIDTFTARRVTEVLRRLLDH